MRSKNRSHLFQRGLERVTFQEIAQEASNLNRRFEHMLDEPLTFNTAATVIGHLMTLSALIEAACVEADLLSKSKTP